MNGFKQLYYFQNNDSDRTLSLTPSPRLMNRLTKPSQDSSLKATHPSETSLKVNASPRKQSRILKNDKQKMSISVEDLKPAANLHKSNTKHRKSPIKCDKRTLCEANLGPVWSSEVSWKHARFHSGLSLSDVKFLEAKVLIFTGLFSYFISYLLTFIIIKFIIFIP